MQEKIRKGDLLSKPQAQAPQKYFGGHTHQPKLIREEAATRIPEGALSGYGLARMPAAALSGYGLISEEELARELSTLAASKLTGQDVVLPPIMEPSARQNAKKKNALEEWYSAMRIWLLSFLGRVLTRQQKRKLTQKGELTLGQLRMLADLYLASGIVEGMDVVALEAEFGRAYYQILQDSRKHYSSHQGKRPHAEDYGQHMESFARLANSIC